MKKTLLIILLIISTFSTFIYAQDTISAKSLISRVLPKHSSQFEVQFIPKDNNQDVFEIDSNNGKIILRGNNEVSVASALYYYLKNVTNCNISWNSTDLNLPEKLPTIFGKVHKTSPYKYRYYLNYCTFNYSMTWWDWKRWEKEIDWMALHGINMPLALTGQDAVWQRVYKGMGFTDEDMNNFFSGPAYSAFNWFGLLNGWGGPLPKNWITSQEALQKKILKRERSLGMTPILPAFTGHVPPAFKEKFPNSKLNTIQWVDFPKAYSLAPNDSMFAKIGEKFIKEETKTFGTDHFYAADAFIEVIPPSADSIFLNDMSYQIYQSMAKTDPKATWILEGWMFHFVPKFWKPTQIKALLNAVPDDKMIILDLYSEIAPVWNRTDAYYGKPWIWNMLHNFGGASPLIGNMPAVANGPSKALHDPESGKLRGIGLTMEGINQNPALYELMLDNTWTDSSINLDDWVIEYAKHRYGKSNIYAEKAWNGLKNTVYSNQGRGRGPSVITARPRFSEQFKRISTDNLAKNAKELLSAWKDLIIASKELRNRDGFQYDLVDVTRQVLADYAGVLLQKYSVAFKEADKTKCKKYAKQFMDLIDDIDKLVATRKESLLGVNLESAKRWGTNKKEKELYEWNARNILTLWHGKDDHALIDYAARQWAGLLKGFYKQRWKQFFNYAENCLENKKDFDMKLFDKNIRNWEWNWVNGHEIYTSKRDGNSVEIAREMYKKYYSIILFGS